MDKIVSLADAFIIVRVPKIDRTKKHNIVDILIIAQCATFCGVEGWEEIEIFAEVREEWFRGFLELPTLYSEVTHFFLLQNCQASLQKTFLTLSKKGMGA